MVSNHISFVPIKLLWDRSQIFIVAFYYVLFGMPFFFIGALIATVFSLESRKSHAIYCSDLIGAGAGSLAVLALLNFEGPEYAVLTASFLCFIASFITGRKKIRSVVSVLFITIMFFVILQPGFFQMRLSPYKNLSLSLKYPGAEHLNTYYNSFSRIDTFRSPAVRFAPGLSLTYLNPLPEQVGCAIDGDDMNAVTKAGNSDALAFIEFLPSSLAYEIAKTRGDELSKESVIIIEPKGGLQALTASYYGVEDIYNVESNPLFIKVVKRDFGSFSGNIYDRRTWTGLGRSWLTSTRSRAHEARKFNIIDLPLTSTSVSSVFGISEDYRFTEEAFRKYFTSLKEHGFLSISLYLLPPPRIELRVLTTVIAMLEDAGKRNVSDHITAIRSWDTLTVLVKNAQLEKNEIRAIKAFANNRRFDLVYYPGITEQESNRYVKMQANEYFQAFQKIINPDTRQLFLQDYIFDISPVSDENPFFNYFLKLSNIKAIYEVMGQKWQYFIKEGYLVPMIFLQVFIFSAILILLPVFFRNRYRVSQDIQQRDLLIQMKRSPLTATLPFLLFFALIGMGFMLVEITMIQKNMLSLENPALTVATVLTAILISSGVGGLLSTRISEQKIPYLILTLGGLLCVYVFLFPLFINAIFRYSLSQRTPMVFLSLVPLGFFMGMPFPTGMRVLGQLNERLIPWAWAINGCMSVLAPVLAVMLALSLGYKSVLLLGAATYVIASFFLRGLIKQQIRQREF
jgi:hypothetical protein